MAPQPRIRGITLLQRGTSLGRPRCLRTLQLERHALHTRLMWMEARIQCGEAVESSELEAMRRSAERQFFWRGVAMVETLQAQLDGAGS